jgi:hypothetical protein
MHFAFSVVGGPFFTPQKNQKIDRSLKNAEIGRGRGIGK